MITFNKAAQRYAVYIIKAIGVSPHLFGGVKYQLNPMEGRGVVRYKLDLPVWVTVGQGVKCPSELTVRFGTVSGREFEGVFGVSESGEVFPIVSHEGELYEWRGGQYDPRCCTEVGSKYVSIQAEWLLASIEDTFSEPLFLKSGEGYEIREFSSGEGFEYVPTSQGCI